LITDYTKKHTHTNRARLQFRKGGGEEEKKKRRKKRREKRRKKKKKKRKSRGRRRRRRRRRIRRTTAKRTFPYQARPFKSRQSAMWGLAFLWLLPTVVRVAGQCGTFTPWGGPSALLGQEGLLATYYPRIGASGADGIPLLAVSQTVSLRF
jgi:hypothetical protein